MSRHRTLKPSFFTHDVLGELPPLARLLFQGLWCHADREGRLEDRPRYLRTVVLPYDECDCDELLGQLHDAKLIARYEVDGRKLIAIPRFAVHQRPHPKERKSELPPPEPIQPRNDWPWENPGTPRPRKAKKAGGRSKPVRVVRQPPPSVYPPRTPDEAVTAKAPTPSPPGTRKRPKPPTAPPECGKCHGATLGAVFNGVPLCDGCFDEQRGVAHA